MSNPEQEQRLRRIIQLSPSHAEAHFQLGKLLSRIGRLEEALRSYDRAINAGRALLEARRRRNGAHGRLRPTAASHANELKVHLGRSYLEQGVILHRLLRAEDALASYNQAIKLQPDLGEAHFGRGNVLADLKRLDESLESYDQAIAFDPSVAAAYYNRGNVRRARGRLVEALADYDKAIELKADYGRAYNNRGTTQLALGRLRDALLSFDRAIELEPGLAEAFYNRANVLREDFRLEEALASYEQAIRLRPDYTDAHNNMAGVLVDLMRPERALEYYTRAMRLAPNVAATYVNCGNVLKELGRLNEARANYQMALKLQPKLEFLYGTWLHAKMSLCDWECAEEQLLELCNRIKRREKASSPFPVITLTGSESLQRQAAELWVQTRHPLTGAAAGRSGKARSKRIRLGYYSADFRNHATMFLMAGLFEQHDRSRFELFGFSFGAPTDDSLAQRASAAFDEFYDVRLRSDEDVVRLARELGIDIAVDLKGFTQGHRAGIFARRAAPIQVSYLGFPGTMGASYIDYLIADRTIVPIDSMHHYAEKIAYLPHSYQINDRSRIVATEPSTRKAVGLPEKATVLCCFHNSYKILPEVFDHWTNILKRVKGSVLWLLEDSDATVRNLRKEASARGVDSRRLIFAKRIAPAQHLARLRLADLFLDTLPCNAHTTASDALWVGLPLVTCMGQTFAGRVGASLLKAVQLPELITTSLDEYEDLVVRLSHQPSRLRDARCKLERNRYNTPLFDTAQTTRSLEALYMQMYERYVNNYGVAHIWND
jgi:protein O-GlcNAc transferase